MTDDLETTPLRTPDQNFPYRAQTTCYIYVRRGKVHAPKGVTETRDVVAAYLAGTGKLYAAWPGCDARHRCALPAAPPGRTHP